MNNKQLLFTLSLLLPLAGCANSSYEKYNAGNSYLKNERENKSQSGSLDQGESENPSGTEASKMSVLPAFSTADEKSLLNSKVVKALDDKATLSVTAEEMPLAEFIHYVFGELLELNYILGEGVDLDKNTVSLNIKDSISKARLFEISNEVLSQRQYSVKQDKGVMYIAHEDNKQGRPAVEFGYGINESDVPATSFDVVQVVPVQYGMQNSINIILPQITSAKMTPDGQRGVYILRGSRTEVIKAMTFIRLLDVQNHLGKHVGTFNSTYVSPEILSKKLNELLFNEGIKDGVKTVILESQSLLVLFATDKKRLDRAMFWLDTVDTPDESKEKQYYVYQTKYARARDLMESLSPLLGGGQKTSSLSSSTGSTESGSQVRQLSTGNEKVSIVVDERSNSLVVNASGKDYKNLLPLIRRLDVLPKQVALEVTIAEVRLEDEFKFGLEFFLTENNFTLGNRGNFGVNSFGGLTYMLTGSSKWDVRASLHDKNRLINIVSRPSLVVRDGVTAKMQVGTDIPIVSSISSPDVGTTTSVQYRKTGLNLEVTPTVNSQGVVIMEISQQISSVVEDGITAEGAPSIFDRSMSTEVVANSGQTVILGGLISENNTNTENQVPGIGEIPLIGRLFSSESDIKDKTELVIMVTPKIIESENHWKDLRDAFQKQLEQITL